MPKVKVLKKIKREGGRDWLKGEVVEVSNDYARELVATGKAEITEQAPPPIVKPTQNEEEE